MTPKAWALYCEAHNEKNGGDEVSAPSREEFKELVKLYG